MDFIDNVIDRTTGTIRGRAKFDNSNGTFVPGMFARVRVPASSPYQALLVPDVAIGSEQARKFVLAVDVSGTAQQKYVTLGQLVGDLRVIKEGIADGDRVVVNGMAKVRPGQKVTVQEAPQPGAVAKPSAANVTPATPAKTN